MKQTASEWLIDQLEKHYVKVDIKNTAVFYQAKEMEKQQIIDAYNEGGCNWDSELEAEQYYNQTFKEIEKP
jgi:arginine decarboxylase-like protein